MMVYIKWAVQDFRFVEWKYIGGGVNEPVFEEITVNKKVLWSQENSQERINEANEYIKTDMQDRLDAHIVVE